MSDKFIPVGGFPPIVKKQKKIDQKTLESRGFASTNIVSINNIMNSKKKENLFTAFGSTNDDLDTEMAASRLFDGNSATINEIDYNDL